MAQEHQRHNGEHLIAPVSPSTASQAPAPNVSSQLERAVTVQVGATIRHQKMEGFGESRDILSKIARRPQGLNA
ncbi:hypothetical protein [Abditibacterium utsteinense]|nr:hypothetical protein [Abditibacterium utsteinense]